MGGGGGFFPIDDKELEAAEKEARKSIKAGAEPEKYNVFISFISEDLDYINLLRGQAKNEHSDLEFRDYSIKEPFDSEKADYLKRRIREKIKQSSVTVVYVSNDTASSKWVDWEIRESIKLGKGVIAMHKKDAPPENLPSAIKEFGIKIVPWNHKKISDAIKSASKGK